MPVTPPPPAGLAYRSGGGLPPPALKAPKVELEDGSFHTLRSPKRFRQDDASQGAGLEGMDVTTVSASLLFANSRNQCLLKKEAVPQGPLKQFHFNPLEEPSPLGLSLRKSPSLLELIQGKITQNTEQDQEINLENDGGFIVPSSAEKDKLKAANFPASLLKIGTWECSSRYEGDLVAKCYYAKCKLVWEVLKGGLKSKIEIQWSDITALKASCPENHKGSLDIEISRPPLFFRETNPQPRKHTSWQSSSDFTGGQASICRHHRLEFPEGVFNRHFEKLLQCDVRLKVLSEQIGTIIDSSFFEPQKLPGGMEELHRRDIHFKSPLHQINEHSIIYEDLKAEMVPSGSKRGNDGFIIPQSGSPSSGVEESGSSDTDERLSSFFFPPPRPRSHIVESSWMGQGGLSARTEPSSSSSSSSCSSRYNSVSGKQMLDEISLHLLGEPFVTPGIAHYNIGPPLTPTNQVPTTDLSIREPLSNPPQMVDELQLSSKRNSDNNCSSPRRPSELETTMRIPRDPSCGDLLYLPRIASLPQFFIPPPT